MFLRTQAMRKLVFHDEGGKLIARPPHVRASATWIGRRHRLGLSKAILQASSSHVGWRVVSDVIVPLLGVDPAAFHDLIVRSGETGEALAKVWPAELPTTRTALLSHCRIARMGLSRWPGADAVQPPANGASPFQSAFEPAKFSDCNDSAGRNGATEYGQDP